MRLRSKKRRNGDGGRSVWRSGSSDNPLNLELLFELQAHISTPVKRSSLFFTALRANTKRFRGLVWAAELRIGLQELEKVSEKADTAAVMRHGRESYIFKNLEQVVERGKEKKKKKIENLCK